MKEASYPFLSNRLYRTALSIELAALEKEYIIFGSRDNDILPFVQNEDFDGFLLKKRYEKGD